MAAETTTTQEPAAARPEAARAAAAEEPGLERHWAPAAATSSTYTNAADVSGHPEQEITTGGGEVIEAGGPGVDYDTAADDLVAWVGGAPWILELGSKVWSQSQATGGPAKPSDRGTFGRFRYVPRLNVFVLVNSVDEDVAFYKHTAGCGNPP